MVGHPGETRGAFFVLTLTQYVIMSTPTRDLVTTKAMKTKSESTNRTAAPAAKSKIVVAPAIPAELKVLAKSQYEHHKAKLAADAISRAEDEQFKRAKAALFAGMGERYIRGFFFKTELADGPVILEAKIGPGRATSMIDCAKLRARVSDKVFMRIVEATAKAVEELAGADILAECKVTIPGAETVTVKPKA